MIGPVEEKEELVEKLVHRLILDAHTDKASDIHMEPMKNGGMKLRYRRDGALQDITTLSSRIADDIRGYIKKRAGCPTDTPLHSQRGRFTVEAREIEEGLTISLKSGFLSTQNGERITLSINPFSPSEAAIRMGFEALGMKGDDLGKAQSIFNRTSGLMLVTGIPGSGRTTTITSALTHISRKRSSQGALLISLEEQIANPIDGIVQVQVKPGIEGMGYCDQLQTVMWQDPDVVAVSAVPDRETARMICETVLSGRMVVVQMENPDALRAIAHFVNLTGEPSLVSSILEGVLSQRLVRCICDDCREEYEPEQDVIDRYFLSLYRKWFQSRYGSGGETGKVTLFRGQGCEKCRYTGFRGRTGLFEIMIPDLDIRDLIASGFQLEQLKEILVEKDFLTLKEKALFYALSGITTLEEAQRASY
ncbi:MAG: GspE/PulE family protein [Vulcanimicrobiota bacterium]